MTTFREIASQFSIPLTKRTYTIGKYELELPPHFTLPQYQKAHKLYDRFLPVLAKHLNGSKLIVDVGANIGDTVIAMLQHCANPILCIEPSDVFFPYLENNLRNLTLEDFSQVKRIKKFVGTGSLAGALRHTNATASLTLDQRSTTITHTALDDLVDDLDDVLLVKVDTDGFDFDVINSAKEILSQSEPILFWENEITDDFQYKGFYELYSLLEKLEYKYIYIFDNFGNLITEEVDFKTLRFLNSYLYSMRKHSCSRTFFYTDILAATEKNHVAVERAINEYTSQWINK